LLDGAFDAATEVAVPNDSNSDLHLSGSMNERVRRKFARAATTGPARFRRRRHYIAFCENF